MGLLTTHRTLVLVLWIVGFALVFGWQLSSMDGVSFFRRGPVARPIPRLRPVAYNLTDFGGVGDGKTLNTEAFERAVEAISKLGARGGGQLNVPPGFWLTAPFNLTTLLKHLACLKAFLMYETGHNGTINGQGQMWWTKYKKRILNYTRGPLVQLMWSKDIVISNITLRDSPFWTLHPYDCKNVTISHVTILAPVSGAPNTDGIDPDSCEDVLIENCYICVGDDAVAIKSGWDQYGIAYGRPSANITLRNLTVQSVLRKKIEGIFLLSLIVYCFKFFYHSHIFIGPIFVDHSAGISIGSEMSGGVSNITVENLIVWESRRGIRIKTAPGRGGYVRNIFYRNVTLDNVRVGIVIKTDYNEHPDEGFDPAAVPIIKNITYSGIHGQGVRVPVRIDGSEEIPVKDISFRDISIGLSYKKKHIFQCSFVEGRVIGSIFPAPCENLDLYDEQGRLVKLSSSQNSTDIDYDI
ncbi:hypothetical protein GW17_00053052 [Ensete ventricosum]|nr:hypothetical protein GW17_00053052 [Ensete ventricosum]RZR89166.1 hypothetical protein BHM03_00016837 [Ensete ventricosum]